MPAQTSRVAALDLLRGLAVAGMILVANTGDWAHTYAPLKHADWNGWTAADVVFPMFLFGVGMALGLSFPRDLSTSPSRRMFWSRVARRVALLVLLGLALNGLYNLAVALGEPPIGPDDHPALRLPGVLQRIALCYGLAAVLIVATARRDGQGYTAIRPWALAASAGAILVGYWLMLRYVPTPGFGPGRLDQVGSLPAYVDRAVFTPAHMYPMGSTSWRGPVTYDSEGLLASLPATVNVLFGVLAAYGWRRKERPPLELFVLAGILLVVLGLLADRAFPINKKLWTSSFVLLTGGLSVLALVAVHLATLDRRASALLTPLRVLGGNAILAFALSIILQSFAGLPLGRSVPAITPQHWADGIAEAIIPDPYRASLACSLAVIAVITLLLAPLHRRAIHFRL